MRDINSANKGIAWLIIFSVAIPDPFDTSKHRKQKFELYEGSPIIDRQELQQFKHYLVE